MKLLVVDFSFRFSQGSEIHNNKKNFKQCKGNHFHDCTFSKDAENEQEYGKNRKSADGEQAEAFEFLDVYDEKQCDWSDSECYVKTCCNPVQNSFGVP